MAMAQETGVKLRNYLLAVVVLGASSPQACLAEGTVSRSTGAASHSVSAAPGAPAARRQISAPGIGIAKNAIGATLPNPPPAPPPTIPAAGSRGSAVGAAAGGAMPTGIGSMARTGSGLSAAGTTGVSNAGVPAIGRSNLGSSSSAGIAGNHATI